MQFKVYSGSNFVETREYRKLLNKTNERDGKTISIAPNFSLYPYSKVPNFFNRATIWKVSLQCHLQLLSF